MVTQVEDGYLVTVRNIRTNKIATGVIKSGYFAATFADLSRKSVVNAGDRLEVAVMDKSGGIASEPVFVSVTPDMRRNANVMISRILGSRARADCSKITPTHLTLKRGFHTASPSLLWSRFRFITFMVSWCERST
jgi:hypothetical protein